MNKSIIEMAADIVQAQSSARDMSQDEIKAALQEVFNTLRSLQGIESGTAAAGAEAELAIAPAKSIQANKIICLECGQEFKMLSPKHLASHGLTSVTYRQKYGFRRRQPLCAKNLSKRRSAAGKERGLPDNLRRSIEARVKKKVAPAKAAAPKAAAAKPAAAKAPAKPRQPKQPKQTKPQDSAE
jgi:predicted transcriptional regulator